jgi:hypothetical protein
MVFLLTLGVRQALLDALYVRFADMHLAAQLALPLAGFFRQDMTTVGLTALEAIRCFAKTLRRSPLSFQLGHDRLLFVALLTSAPKILRFSMRRYRRDGKLF